jgi:hypothetical protein
VTYRLSLVLPLFGCLVLVGASNLSAMPSPIEVDREMPAADDAMAGRTRLAQAQTPQAPQAADPAAAAQAQTQAPVDEPIGNVATLTGSASVIRNSVTTPLKPKDDIFFNDTVQTSANSTLGITFNDATTFNLKASSKMTIDNYVYEEGGSQNTGIFDIAKGTVAFVAAAVAKTGDMKITTPTATLGIRGTTGLVEVPEGAAATSPNNVAIKLYPDADGKVGRIEVNDRAGARLGALTQGASGFTIRPGMGGGARFAAVPLAISPREVQRDQGFVRQVHAAQNVGRQIVTEQRAFRRANPGLNNNRGNQPGQQRPNGAPGQSRPGQPQPGAPNRPGTQQPGTPSRQGTQQNRTPQNGTQPNGSPRQPGNPQQQGRPSQPTRPGQTPPSNPQGRPTSPQPGGPNGQGNRQGTQLPQPGGPGQPSQPPRPGQLPQQGAGQPGTPARPAAPSQPGLPQRLGVPQQGAPGALRPGLPNRPTLQRPRPGAAPKGKPEKKRLY